MRTLTKGKEVTVIYSFVKTVTKMNGGSIRNYTDLLKLTLKYLAVSAFFLAFQYKNTFFRKLGIGK